MKITSAKKYRKGKTKVIKLPSGSVFKIKKPAGRVMASLLNLFDVKISVNEDLSKEEISQELEGLEFQDKLVNIMDLLIPSCVVDPKISLVETDDEDLLFIDDIEYSDLYSLIDEIMAFSGISKEATDERESFPE